MPKPEGKTPAAASSGSAAGSAAGPAAGHKRPRDDKDGDKKAAAVSTKGQAQAKTNAKEAKGSSNKRQRKEEKESDESDESSEESMGAGGYSSSGTESDDIDDLDLRREADSEDEDDDEDGSDSEDNVINVEFEFFDPREVDFKSVRRLLEHYLPGEETTFDASGMADAIIAQQALGTMVKVVDDPDVYAFATILPIDKYKVSDAPLLAMRHFTFAARQRCLSLRLFASSFCFPSRSSRRIRLG